MEQYLIAMTCFGAIYALLALGLNFAWGLTGLINLGLAGFFALGAYASALATTVLGWPIALGIAFGFVVAAASGAVVTLATLRLRGDYLAIVTLGFAELVRLIATNETWLTRGSDGISGVPGPWRGTLAPAEFNLLFCAIALGAVAIALVLAELLRASPFGRVLRALREDETVAQVAGKWTTIFKVQAFAIGAGLMGVAGALYAHYTSFVVPDLFRPLITIYIFLALTAGGTGNNRGAVIGAFVVMAILESTRFMTEIVPGLRAVQVAALREMLIGGLLLVILRVRPQGLFPEPLPKHGERR